MNSKFDYSYLRGFIKEVFKSNEKYAKFLGISTTQLYERLGNRIPFTQNEIYKTAFESKDKPLTPDEVNLIFFKR